MSTRQSAQEIREAIRGIESDITDREKRITRRQRSRDRATENGDHAKAARIAAEIADETNVLEAARTNLVRHRAVLEEIEAEARAAYAKRAEERRVEVSNFAERMLSRYHNGEMADRFGKIEPDIQNLTITPNGSSYIEVGMVIDRIISPGKEWERREAQRFSTTVNLRDPKVMRSWLSDERGSEVNWPAYGSQDPDTTRCFGQILRVAASVAEWADSVLPEE